MKEWRFLVSEGLDWGGWILVNSNAEVHLTRQDPGNDRTHCVGHVPPLKPHPPGLPMSLQWKVSLQHRPGPEPFEIPR